MSSSHRRRHSHPHPRENTEWGNLSEVVGPEVLEDPKTLLDEGQESSREKDTDLHDKPEGEDLEIYSSNLDGYSHLNELVGPSPTENPHEHPLYHHHDLEEARSADRREEQRYEKETGTKQHRAADFLTKLYATSYLVLFSILGTLARLGLQALTNYPGSPALPTEMWANVGGSFIMGYLSEDRVFFKEEEGDPTTEKPPESDEDGDASSSRTRKPSISSLRRARREAHLLAKKTIPLYIGLSVGFCGSFTSFSSLIRDAFLALANDLSNKTAVPAPRNQGYSVMAVLGVIFMEVSLCFSALTLGAHIAILLEPLQSKLPRLGFRRILDPTVILIGWGAWIGAIVMSIWPPDRPHGPQSNVGSTGAQEHWRGQVLFALVFAPVGCLMRFHVSIKLNSLLIAFPLGTFAVNIFGTMVLAMCWDLQRAPLSGGVGGGRVGCQVLQGVIDGFCGCLTTVSTWIVELKGLRRRHSYVYGISSVGIGLVVAVIIMGPLLWTDGVLNPACKV